MSDTSQNNKRIAKNTLLLYSRMILIMLVSLYTSIVINLYIQQDRSTIDKGLHESLLRFRCARQSCPRSLLHCGYVRMANAQHSF